jgi:hypothetical protein
MKALMNRISWLYRASAVVLTTALVAACGGGSEEEDAASVDAKASMAAPRLEAAAGADDDESGVEAESQATEAEAVAVGTSALADLPNGGSITGSIAVGQTVTHTFSARTGEGVQLRLADVAATAFIPRLYVYGPTGALVTSDWGYDVANIGFAAPATGDYTAVVTDYYGTVGGNYELHYARAPGAKEGRTLRNGGVKSGTLTLGDLDSFTFRAKTGEGIQLRLADIDATALIPRIFLYGPTGALVASDWGYDVASLTLAAPATGTYTIVIADYYGNGVGDYELRLTRAPGAKEEGALVNGGARNQTMTLGDLDSYTFTATVGEGVHLRLVDLNATGFIPRLWVYGPTGALVSSDWGYDAADTVFAAPATGTYTVVAADYYGTGTGDYELHHVRGTGANEHGSLIDEGTRSETATRGDLDSFTFVGNTGDVVQLRLTDVAATAFIPRLYLYGPTGALVATTWNYDVAVLNVNLPAAGTYTVIAADYYGTGTGDYTLGYTNSGQ